MYEELQKKARPKPPRRIMADGIKGLFGIVSPSKLLYEQCRIDGAGEEVRRYLEENRKYLLYRRRLNRQQWEVVYREYRRAQQPERAEAWEKKCQEAAAEALRCVRLLIGE
jgi:hypothetical protein